MRRRAGSQTATRPPCWFVPLEDVGGLLQPWRRPHAPTGHAAQACDPRRFVSRWSGVTADGALADFTKTIKHHHGAQPVPAHHPLPRSSCLFSLPPLFPLQPSHFATSTSWVSDRGCRDAEASRLPGAKRRRLTFARTSGVLQHWGTVGRGWGGGGVDSVRSGTREGLAAISTGRGCLNVGRVASCVHMLKRDFTPKLAVRAGNETRASFFSP